MEWLQLDRLEVHAELVWLKTFSFLYFKASQQVLGLGWVYLATEGILPLACLTHQREIPMKLPRLDGIQANRDLVWLKSFRFLSCVIS
jgi:hypothetical protein